MPEPHRLPPTKDALILHIQRCNYQVGEWKEALLADHNPGNPDGRGWERTDDGLQIKWMTNSPAPEEILELVTCNCKKSNCATNACPCFVVNLKCVDLCNCKSCQNSEFDDEGESEFDSDDESEDESDDESEGESDDELGDQLASLHEHYNEVFDEE